MKKIIEACVCALAVFIGFSQTSFAQEIIEIVDDPVPETVASHCNVHWAVLLVIGIYAVYASIRAIANKRAMQNESDGSEGK